MLLIPYKKFESLPCALEAGTRQSRKPAPFFPRRHHPRRVPDKRLTAKPALPSLLFAVICRAFLGLRRMLEAHGKWAESGSDEQAEAEARVKTMAQPLSTHEYRVIMRPSGQW